MSPDLLIFGMTAAVTWLGVIYFWPRLLLSVFKRAIVHKGLGAGPIAVNTLGTQPAAIFADPLHVPDSASPLASVGVNRDTLLSAGWLDLSKGPLVLHVPAMQGRYYAVQFTNAATNTVFAYIGTRTTGSQAGDYLITGPRWTGIVPDGLTRIASPNRSVLLIGRVLVHNDRDLSTAYDLSTQLRLTSAQ